MKRNWLGVVSVLLCLLFVGGTTMATVADAAAGGRSKAEKCQNGKDDDKDGLIDCADPDCFANPACAPPAEICTNGIDDDGDSLVDCADPDCNGSNGCEFGTELTCNDALDNDADGDIDCADFDCAGDPACAPPAEICTNGLDDDGDTLVDCADPDCNGSNGCEFGTELTCNDALDNDADGDIDCADFDCAGDPACAPPMEICTNGIDDDGDSLVDCADPDCASDPACIPAVEICNNGLDDDGDSLVDCADPDCAGTPSCVPMAENCANGHDDDGDGLVDCADPDCTGDVACSTGKHAFNILMNYELGMHCTGFEFAYCCVLPPYNSILAQVVKTDKTAPFPRMLEADPNVGLDGLGRPTVVRDPVLSGSGFKKYRLRYSHEAQPRNDGRGAPQTSTLISIVEGNSLLMWNTVAEGATTAGGALVYGGSDGATNVVQGDGDFNDANDNYWNAVWNHLYFYEDLEGSNSTGSTAEADKIRLGIDVIYPESTGAALHPVGPGVNSPLTNGNVLTFSGDTGTVVYTQMKVLENLPVMLTSPRIWEALGLPLTPFEDTINFFADPGAVDEDSIRPYVKMKAELVEYPSGAAVLDGGEPVIGFGTAPIDIPNCERCHSLADGVSVNSAQNGKPAIDVMVQDEIDFWNAYYNIGPGDSDWYSRLKGAAISILAIHDDQHGTNFTGAWPVAGGAMPQATRLGHGSVICQRCHADNVIAVVKSANTGAGDLIMPLSEALHNNHKDNPFSDSLGRNGGCQGCHPAHRSDGDMRNYPITEDGLNAFAAGDNRDAAGGCFVGRDVHSNRNKDTDGVETPSHLNAVGQWLADNVASDTGTWKGIWCTNCHSQLGQELWKTENCPDLIHGDCLTNPRGEPTLAAVAAAVGVSEAQAIAWLDPKNNNDTATIWTPAASLCDWLAGNAAPEEVDGNVATIEVAIASAGHACSTPDSVGPIDCSGVGGPVFDICGTFDGDASPDFSVNILDFCTTADCVAAAQGTLVNSAAVAVPMSAATDGRDHWLAPGEPHCADCHTAPYVEQSGNITAYPPFNYPRKASLFRYTRGHQDITCQGCHESIHGLYPSAQIVNQDGDTVTIDTTTYAQAAYLNPDGSHGPVKCAACHDVDSNGIPQWVRSGLGSDVNSDYDAAVGWAHTFTDEASVLGPGQVCRNCHGVQGSNWSEIVNPSGTYLRHAQDGRVSRTMMDKAEIETLGHVHGDPAFENPLANNSSAICQGCHGSEVSHVSCSNTTWKRHLTEGRVAESVWVYVSETLTGTTCGW